MELSVREVIHTVLIQIDRMSFLSNVENLPQTNKNERK